jgi:tRNA pseudouridine55 synthase
MDGIFLVDKPSGPTSFDVVRKVRRVAGERKVGHTGTLDPLASGLIVCCLGQGTKLVPYLMDSAKRYLAGVSLGEETDTDDSLGDVISREPVPNMNKEMIDTTLANFVGLVNQVPPKFSALKRGGEPLYRKARRGEDVQVAAREVEILCLDLVGSSDSSLELDIRCGKGTYVRALARDIGRALGTRGHLSKLRRVETAGFFVEDALCLNDLAKIADEGKLSSCLIKLENAIPFLKKIQLTEAQEQKIVQGQALSLSIAPSLMQEEHIGLLGVHGHLRAIAKVTPRGIRPVRVLV